MPAVKQSQRACQGWKPTSGSTWSRASASGLLGGHLLDVDTPPCVVSMNSGFFSPRSNVTER